MEKHLRNQEHPVDKEHNIHLLHLTNLTFIFLFQTKTILPDIIYCLSKNSAMKL